MISCSAERDIMLPRSSMIMHARLLESRHAGFSCIVACTRFVPPKHPDPRCSPRRARSAARRRSRSTAAAANSSARSRPSTTRSRGTPWRSSRRPTSPTAERLLVSVGHYTCRGRSRRTPWAAAARGAAADHAPAPVGTIPTARKEARLVRCHYS